MYHFLIRSFIYGNIWKLFLRIFFVSLSSIFRFVSVFISHFSNWKCVRRRKTSEPNDAKILSGKKQSAVAVYGVRTRTLQLKMVWILLMTSMAVATVTVAVVAVVISSFGKGASIFLTSQWVIVDGWRNRFKSDNKEKNSSHSTATVAVLVQEEEEIDEPKETLLITHCIR